MNDINQNRTEIGDNYNQPKSNKACKQWQLTRTEPIQGTRLRDKENNSESSKAWKVVSLQK